MAPDEHSHRLPFFTRYTCRPYACCYGKSLKTWYEAITYFLWNGDGKVYCCAGYVEWCNFAMCSVAGHVDNM